ncbi:hypothetical protein BG015_001898 [Linnemannia schmuckeri]|uniref:EH domain-containing protein n=1 Tax=Linnemannia schmuckeri TaxID=64567 RepID=A0A9P5S3N9_9FUNG|nr:hypothetical protein BG015_001898 [Linnemannia schmuckeri]
MQSSRMQVIQAQQQDHPTERQLYDTLWKQANPQGAARIGAVQAVEFLNLSGISPVTLAAVWDLTALNEQGQDYYDRNAFDAALRLIGHAQKGIPLSVAMLTVESRPTLNTAGLSDAAAYPLTAYNQFSGAPPAAAWPPLPVGEIKTYRDLFKNLDKENGVLKYDVVLHILLKSGLPTATLAKILALVDRRKRAELDEDEYVMAMYFVMCLKKKAITALPPSLPEEVKQICQVKELPSPNAELNYYNVLFNPNPNASERERELLAILQTQQQQQEKLQEVYLQQILENSKAAEQRIYQQSIDHSRATQEQLAPFLAANAFGNSPYAAIFAEGYNNAARQQQELMERLVAAHNPLPTTLPQVPADNPPAYSAQQPGAFFPTPSQQSGAFSPVPAFQQQYPQSSQYQQQPLQAYPVQLQQQQQQQAFQPQAMTAYTQQQQYNPYAQYTQQTPTSPGHQGAAAYQSYPPPPQGNPQYQKFAPGQLQQHPMSPGQPQQHSMSPGNPQQQPMSPGNPQYQFAQGHPAHQQQQPSSPGGPQQHTPPRQPQMYAQQQAVGSLSVPLPPTPTSPVGPPLPSRAPQDRNDYSITAATTVSTASTTTTSAISSVPPPLPRRPGQQQQYQPGGPQEIPVAGRAPQYREPISEEARRPFGAPQLRKNYNMTQPDPPTLHSTPPPPPPLATSSSSPSNRLRVEPDDIFLRDASNRAWLLRGVNLSGSCKFPRYPVSVPSHQGGPPFLQPRKLAHGQRTTVSNSSVPAASAAAVVTTATTLDANANGIHNAGDAEPGRNEDVNGNIRSVDETGTGGKTAETTITTDTGTGKDKDDNGLISFVGRPYELDEADEHLGRLKHWGFRMIRWVVTWEAVEHAGPGVYDQEFLDYTVKALLKAKEYGFKVMIDFHQDVWSRFSGGSGAPLWTFYAAGLDPHHFAATGAAAVHNTLQDNEPLLRMVWLTNYYKLACATMFTLFYAGKILAPNCTFDNGVNIQDYLQEHFLGAIQALVDRIHDCKDGEGRNLLEDDVVIGYDSWNEPSNGWIGLERLDVLPEQHDMRQGDMPTPLQSLMLGEGMTVQNVATFQLELVGPVKTGTRTIQPSAHPDAAALPRDKHPIKAWLHPTIRAEVDRKYGFRRDERFPRAGECLWAQHGVWSNKDRKVLQQDYFARGPLTSGDQPPLIQWVPNHWLPFAKRVIELVRSIHPTAILFLEPPVYVPAPDLITGTKAAKTPEEAPNKILLDNMVYTPHHYDDLVLLTKKYLGWVNIDLLGLSRGRHKSLYGSIIFGKKATESLFGRQIGEIQKECYGRLGKRPVLIGETGLHFDVGLNKSQQAGNIQSPTISNNTNNDKFKKPSIWKTFRFTSSKTNTTSGTTKTTTTTAAAVVPGRGLPVQSTQFVKAFDNILQGLDRTLAHYTLWNYTIENTKQFGDGWNGEDLSLYSAPPPPSSSTSTTTTTTTTTSADADETVHPLDRGGRAVEQFCRPYPVATVGRPTRIVFDRHFGTFQLWTKTDDQDQELQEQQKGGEVGKSEIYIPQLHFPDGPTKCRVEVSDGSWEWDTERQLLFWTYGSNATQSDNVGGTGGEHWLQVSRKI